MAVGVGLLGLAVQPAQAGLAPTNFSVTPPLSGPGPYTFTYTTLLNNNEKVVTGDFLTIANVGGVIAGTEFAPVGFTYSAALTDPTTITYTYAGPDILGPLSLDFGFVSTVNNIDIVNYAYQDHSIATGNALSGNGTIEGPFGAAVPEASTLAPFALGGLALLGLAFRKSRRTGGAAA